MTVDRLRGEGAIIHDTISTLAAARTWTVALPPPPMVDSLAARWIASGRPILTRWWSVDGRVGLLIRATDDVALKAFCGEIKSERMPDRYRPAILPLMDTTRDGDIEWSMGVDHLAALLRRVWWPHWRRIEVTAITDPTPVGASRYDLRVAGSRPVSLLAWC